MLFTIKHFLDLYNFIFIHLSQFFYQTTIEKKNQNTTLQKVLPPYITLTNFLFELYNSLQTSNDFSKKKKLKLLSRMMRYHMT